MQVLRVSALGSATLYALGIWQGTFLFLSRIRASGRVAATTSVVLTFHHAYFTTHTHSYFNKFSFFFEGLLEPLDGGVGMRALHCATVSVESAQAGAPLLVSRFFQRFSLPFPLCTQTAPPPYLHHHPYHPSVQRTSAPTTCKPTQQQQHQLLWLPCRRPFYQCWPCLRPPLGGHCQAPRGSTSARKLDACSPP